MAGGLVACRSERVPGLHRADARPARRRLASYAPDAAAGSVAVVSDAAGGAASGAPGKPDASDSADRRPGHVLHHGRARTAGESARAVCAADRREHAGHVSRRHSAGPGAAVEGVSCRAAAAGVAAALDSRASRACDREGRKPRRGRRPAGQRDVVAGVHHYLSRAARRERNAD